MSSLQVVGQGGSAQPVSRSHSPSPDAQGRAAGHVAPPPFLAVVSVQLREHEASQSDQDPRQSTSVGPLGALWSRRPWEPEVA